MARQMSPEAREKLSQIAKERHRRGELKPVPMEDRLRGAKLGGRGVTRKKRRITARVAEAAEEEANAKAIIEVFRDAIHPNQPMSIRIKGATEWARIAADHHRTEVAEEAQKGAERSREELIALLQEKLSNGPTARLIRGSIEPETGIMDADVIEAEAEDVGSDPDD